jgi:hypothetical protein
MNTAGFQGALRACRAHLARLAWVLALLAVAPLRAADVVWLVGGGPGVFDSQVQIEANVRWVRQVVRGLGREPRVWFDDGDDPAPDVLEWRPPPETADRLQPLARVMDSVWGNGQHYRNHRIDGVAGGTEAGELRRVLRRELQSLAPQQGAWLIFNGHGSRAPDLDNGIELWRDTRLTVSDLEALLAPLGDAQRFRFVFTQCYAGAFARLARTGPARCGFLAVAPDAEAEGCSAAIGAQDYQDYSTHFFAALAGRRRDGGALPRDPDRDADGVVSPLEAHWHTLVHAASADLPRSTSEAFLEGSEVWPGARIPEAAGTDAYVLLARELLRQAPPETGPARIRRQAALAREWEDLRAEQRQLEQDTEVLRRALETEVLRRWPRSGYAYTDNYRRFLAEDLPAAQAFILARPEYAALRAGQDRLEALDRALLDLDRARLRLEKIHHLLRLAAARRELARRGPAALQERYRELLACESLPF